MGMDPIADDETYELIIEIQGPVNRTDFQWIREQLKVFLDTVTGDGTPGHPGHENSHRKFSPPKPKLQVREARGGQRKKPT